MGRKKDRSLMPALSPLPEHCERFAMITTDIFESEAYQGLSHAARNLYLIMCINSDTNQQSQRDSFEVLKQYKTLQGEDIDETALTELAGGRIGKTYIHPQMFIFPAKYGKQYGYSPQYMNKLKQELIQKGFIKVIYQGKGRYTGFTKNATIYRFSNEWKKLKRT